MPSSLQAADYSVTRFYLNAVKAAHTDDGDKVMEQMRKSTVNDMYAKGGYVRPDGRMVHDMLLLRVKTREAVQHAVGLLRRDQHDQGRRRVHVEGGFEVRALEIAKAAPNLSA